MPASQNQMDPEKVGARPRRPEALPRGKAMKVMKFIQEKSNFKADDGSEILKLIAIYRDFSMKFFTYMPKKFDNKPVDYVNDYNKKITDGENIRIVFYGKCGKSNELEIMEDIDVVDEEKVKGLKFMQEVEEQCSPQKREYESPRKRGYEEYESPRKRGYEEYQSPRKHGREDSDFEGSPKKPKDN